MNRRGFMSSMLALAAAPAIVRAESLMPIVARAGQRYVFSELGVLVPMLGTHIGLVDAAGRVLSEIQKMVPCGSTRDGYRYGAHFALHSGPAYVATGAAMFRDGKLSHIVPINSGWANSLHVYDGVTATLELEVTRD